MSLPAVRQLSVAAILLTAFVGFAARSGTAVIVHQVKRAFSVSDIQVARGDVVQFSNDDPFDHQITIDSPNFKFESPGQSPGSVTPVTFTQLGTFEVLCEIHPRMHLTVTVK